MTQGSGLWAWKSWADNSIGLGDSH